MQVIRFILAAFSARVAYIDCDGCILEKFEVPGNISPPFRLLWWNLNLAPTPVIRRRLFLLYALRLLGVRLVLWTNRGVQHWPVTHAALGKHVELFSSLRFRGGAKIVDRLDGPVMDDDPVYFTCAPNFGNCLLVKSL